MRKLATRLGIAGPEGRRRRLLIVAAVVALSLVPGSMVFATHTFSDVPTSAFYHDSVAAIKNAGITGGCGGSKYCPNSFVTRGQMAVFLDRLGALSDNTTPVVDALSVNGHFIQQGIEQFTLAGGAVTECETTDAGSPNPNPFGSYAITYQIFDTPGALDPEDINVQVRDSDAPADEDDNVFDVCFSTLAGGNLDAGVYKTYFNFVVFIGQGIFGAGASSSSAATSSPARAGR